ncbi:hypothetical protein ACIPF8_20155 [Collimonas sp. NPDC087041]|uniref:hypothetical protein n=1 Tax=Collimonas sp. NPDC087041 TaxID=3363960 RepID=UPI0037FC2E4F
MAVKKYCAGQQQLFWFDFPVVLLVTFFVAIRLFVLVFQHQKPILKWQVTEIVANAPNTFSAIHKETIVVHLIMQNLLFFVPMAIAGLILCGEVPVASRVARGGLRAIGAVCGALLALIILESIPALL